MTYILVAAYLVGAHLQVDLVHRFETLEACIGARVQFASRMEKVRRRHPGTAYAVVCAPEPDVAGGDPDE